MALRILLSASTTSPNVRGTPAGSFSNILTITECAAATPSFKALPLAVGVESIGIRECGADALQDVCGIERPRDRVGGAQCPGLHRAMVQGVARTNNRGMVR